MLPSQVKMARAALGWSLEDLAKATNVHRNTISNFEIGRYRGKTEMLDSVRTALESAGITFLHDDGRGPGIRKREIK